MACFDSFCRPTPTAPDVTIKTSFPSRTSFAACSTILAIRESDGYPSGVETTLVPALRTMRFAKAISSLDRIIFSEHEWATIEQCDASTMIDPREEALVFPDILLSAYALTHRSNSTPVFHCLVFILR